LVEVWVDHDGGQDSHNQSLIEKISEKSPMTMVVVMNPEEVLVQQAKLESRSISIGYLK